MRVGAVGVGVKFLWRKNVLFLDFIFLAKPGSFDVEDKHVSFYTTPRVSGGVLWHHVGCLCVHPSIHSSICPYTHMGSMVAKNYGQFQCI